MKTSDIIKMAKTTKKPTPLPTKKVVVKKEVEPKKVVKPVEIEEDRDTKAKKTIEKLLEGISFNPLDYKKKEVEEVDEDGGEYDGEQPEHENTGGNEWLEQQVTELTQINEYLRNQLANSSTQTQDNLTNYTTKEVVLEDNNVKENVVKLFIELQTVYMNVGFNYSTGIPRTNMIINPEQFMVRLLDFFPFLENYRKIPLQ